MKKVISILFLLLAGIAVMLHAAIPHHHHGKAFTYVVGFLGEDSQHFFNHHELRYSHYDLGQVEVFIQRAQQLTASVYMEPAVAVAATTVDDLSLSIGECDVSVMQKPYVAFGYTAVIIHSFGLRAPPFE